MYLRQMAVTKKEHEARTKRHIESGEAFKRSVKTFFERRDENMRELEGICGLYPYDVAFETNHDPAYAVEPMGAVNTLKEAGCGVFCTAFLRRLYRPNEEFDTIEWSREVASKGYRSWHFTGIAFKNTTFSSEHVDSVEVAKRFCMPELEGLTRNELESKLGKIEGIGVSYFLVDNVIAALTGAEAVTDTRVKDMIQLVSNLKLGIPVVMRVENSVYHLDKARTGGHYITLIGMCDGHFVVCDSSIGVILVPIETILKAATAGTCVVWNCFDVPEIGCMR